MTCTCSFHKGELVLACDAHQFEARRILKIGIAMGDAKARAEVQAILNVLIGRLEPHDDYRKSLEALAREVHW